MSLIKQVLDKESGKFENEAGKDEIKLILVEKIIERKRKQYEKLALLFQFSIFMLLLIFLFFVFRISTNIGDYQHITTIIVIFSVLLLTQVCQKFIGLLDYRK